MEKDFSDIREEILQDAMRTAIKETKRRIFFEKAFYTSIIIIVFLGGVLWLC